MALFKDNTNDYVRDYTTTYNAGKASVNWYDIARDNNKDHNVERVLQTEYFEGGKLYHFRYTPMLKETLKWYDKYPLIISLGQIKYKNNIVETGINLNILPYDVKLYFIDKLYHANRSLILENTTRVNIGEAKRQSKLNLTYEGIISIVNELYLGFAVRNYIKTKMRATYVVSYENWTKMLLINEYFFSKISPEKVYSEYYKYIKYKNKK